MDIFSNHIWEWLILLSLIGGAFYTLKIIGEEKSTFKDESYEVQFSNLSLMIPNWWTIVGQTSEALRFERTDTRYDWYANFTYLPQHDGKTLPQLLEEKLDLEKIEFDMDVVFETDSRVLFRDSEIQEFFQEIIRVEGKASQNVVDRIYYDIYLMRSQNDAGYFIFESRSSVLNGLVEGPYFEESLAELSFIRES
ncbi:hypothetical protein [Peredibacter starrii]|uniref:Uncharacterized protein n=1 Tax=Peredibacter starrii TaxID=28202 RepID=A0AAX4HN74_9BACT|nr:hypothetical protein [Peredibacter starrii]WPU64716.1 hypothetical protein SOO65_18640 [Peredibacter starrii]